MSLANKLVIYFFLYFVPRVLVGPNSYRLELRVKSHVNYTNHKINSRQTPTRIPHTKRCQVSTTESPVSWFRRLLSPPTQKRRCRHQTEIGNFTPLLLSLFRQLNDDPSQTISFRFLSPRQLNISHTCFYLYLHHFPL